MVFILKPELLNALLFCAQGGILIEIAIGIAIAIEVVGSRHKASPTGDAKMRGKVALQEPRFVAGRPRTAGSMRASQSPSPCTEQVPNGK